VVSTVASASPSSRTDFQTIRSLAERDNANIQHWSEFDHGGHYAVLENPDAIVADLRAFFGHQADDLQSDDDGRSQAPGRLRSSVVPSPTMGVSEPETRSRAVLRPECGRDHLASLGLDLARCSGPLNDSA
jgi:hypothetical protein